MYVYIYTQTYTCIPMLILHQQGLKFSGSDRFVVVTTNLKRRDDFALPSILITEKTVS